MLLLTGIEETWLCWTTLSSSFVHKVIIITAFVPTIVESDFLFEVFFSSYT